MTVKIIEAGESASFPSMVYPEFGDCNAVLLIGSDAGSLISAHDSSTLDFMAVELGNECLAEHIGLKETPANAGTIGFARFRMGDSDPGKLVEIVKAPWTCPEVIGKARACFEAAGFAVAVCEDFPGRIVNRLIRPYLNAVLRRLDERLASAEDMDSTLILGLGYPEGPLALLDRTGIAAHHDVTAALYHQLGDTDFAPARRAQVEAARRPWQA